VSSDPLLLLTDTSHSRRARTATLGVLAAAAGEFLVVWGLVCALWYSDAAIGIGFRNFGIGLVTAALVRALTVSQAYLGARLIPFLQPDPARPGARQPTRRKVVVRPARPDEQLAGVRLH